MKLMDVSTTKYPNSFAMVDDEDFDFLNQWKWSVSFERGRKYAVRNGDGRRKIRMHRVILGLVVGQVGDHKDWNGLNNQRSNLRLATNSQNNANRKGCGSRSGFRGVRFNKRCWEAIISKHSKKTHLGCFSTPERAAAAYNKAALEWFGEFAQLNTILCAPSPSFAENAK